MPIFDTTQSMQRLVRQGIYALCWLLSEGVAPWLHAQSLGAAQVLSSLGDPIEVEISVENWQSLDLPRVQIVNATLQQYEAFNLSRLPIVDKLNFNLIGPSSTGEVKVLVSSREPVSEPFVELLLALRWPQGSSLREYVLLFDPPVAPSSSSAKEPVVSQQDSADTGEVDVNALAEEPATVTTDAVPEATVTVVKAESTPAAQTSAPDVKTQVAIEVEPVAAQPTTSPPVQDERRRYQVRSGDTLWVVAKQFHPAGVGENLYQFLISVYELNRNAFINGNISLLKANATLRIPVANEIAAINPSTAQPLFEQRWQEGVNRSAAAANGEALPALSSVYEPASSEIAEFAKQVEKQPRNQEERPPGAQGVESTARAGILAVVGVGQVPVPAPIGTQAPNPAEPGGVVQVAAELVANPYLEKLNVTASNIQTLLSSRQHRLLALEQQIAALKKQLQAAQQAKAPSNLIGGSSQTELWVYAGVSLLLLGAVVITIRLALRLNADLHKLGV
jgi:FimV-like protein